MTNKKGRPALSKNEKTIKLSVSVPASYAAFLKDYGRGNASQGLRWLVDERKSKDAAKEA